MSKKAAYNKSFQKIPLVYPSMHDLKRIAYEGISLRTIAKKYNKTREQMNILLETQGISSWKHYKNRYSSLRYLVIARKIKAKSHSEVARYLKITRQAVQGNAKNYEIIDQMEKKFKRNKKPTLAQTWLGGRAGIILLQTKKGGKFITHTNNLHSFRTGNGSYRKYKEFLISILKFCETDNPKKECFKFRFLNPKYKLIEERSGRFPGVCSHPSGVWAARFNMYLLGYYPTKASAVAALKDYILFGKCKIKKKGPQARFHK